MNAKNQLSRVKAQVFAETKKIDLEIASRHDDGAVIILDYDPSQTIGENLAKNTLNRPSSGGDRARTQTHREPEGLVYGRAHAPSSPTFRNRTLGAEAIADSAHIRRSAVIGGVPYFTAVSAAEAASKAIARNRQEDSFQVCSLQDHLTQNVSAQAT